MRNQYRFNVDGAWYEDDLRSWRVRPLKNQDRHGPGRLLFELLNDGRRLFMRTFEQGVPTIHFVWRPFVSFHPVTFAGAAPVSPVANVRSTEVLRLCYDVHQERTALVHFRYSTGRKKRVEEYLVLTEWTTVAAVLYPEHENGEGNHLSLSKREYL